VGLVFLYAELEERYRYLRCSLLSSLYPHKTYPGSSVYCRLVSSSSDVREIKTMRGSGSGESTPYRERKIAQLCKLVESKWQYVLLDDLRNFTSLLTLVERPTHTHKIVLGHEVTDWHLTGVYVKSSRTSVSQWQMSSSDDRIYAFDRNAKTLQMISK
jgi:hypothetical protein